MSLSAIFAAGADGVRAAMGLRAVRDAPRVSLPQGRTDAASPGAETSSGAPAVPKRVSEALADAAALRAISDNVVQESTAGYFRKLAARPVYQPSSPAKVVPDGQTSSDMPFDAATFEKARQAAEAIRALQARRGVDAYQAVLNGMKPG